MNEPQKLHQLPTDDLQKYLQQVQQALNVLGSVQDMLAKANGMVVATKEQITSGANDMLKTAKEVPPVEPAKESE